jgi:DNA-binding HxlR family transcriptional regulator
MKPTLPSVEIPAQSLERHQPSFLSSNATCPVARTARIISGKWTLLIIRDLASGAKRFHELERSLEGISPKTLSERLRTLEGEGVVTRQTFAEVPPRVEYTLTEKGQDLVEVVVCMRCYGKRWLCDADPQTSAEAMLIDGQVHHS